MQSPAINLEIDLAPTGVNRQDTAYRERVREKDAKVRELHEEGLPNAEIARRSGYDMNSVGASLKRLGLTRHQNPKARPGSSGWVEPIVERPEQTITAGCTFCDFTVTDIFERARAAYREHACTRAA